MLIFSKLSKPCRDWQTIFWAFFGPFVRCQTLDAAAATGSIVRLNQAFSRATAGAVIWRQRANGPVMVCQRAGKNLKKNDRMNGM